MQVLPIQATNNPTFKKLIIKNDIDWTEKYDYSKEQGVQFVYFPYGAGISSSNLKERIYKNYKKLQDKANSHLPVNTEIR